MNGIQKAIALVALFLVSTTASSQEVIKEISNERLEAILKSMNLDFTKGTLNDGTLYFDYTSKNFKLRLYNYKGKDLMIDIFLTGSDWKTVNDWNGKAKFSRARLFRDTKDGKEATVLESNLDLVGGITEEAIRHFIRSFDQEVAAWFAHAAPGTPAMPAASALAEEETFKNFSSDRLEKILKELNINFNKKLDPKDNNIHYYDFKRGDYDVRLLNFRGADLMIDCIFQPAPLAKINEWNLKRPFIRGVLYTNAANGMNYTALESNIDCTPGVSEAMVRYFINAFENEAKEFDKHLRGVK
jgi:Putative bacterial sensory transduction regulator